MPVRGETPQLLPGVVGLGNPSDDAHRTPHNVGQKVLERIVAAAGAAWQRHPEGLVAEVHMGGLAVTLFRPAAGMNNSGPPVRTFLERIGSEARQCIIVHDDMDLELG